MVSCQVQHEDWELERLMRVIEREIEARERAFTTNQAPRRQHEELPTGTTLFSSGSTMPKCFHIVVRTMHQPLA